MKFLRMKVILLSLVTTVLVTSCAVNPVTGKKDLVLVGEEWELAVGKQQYAPLRQSQGGDYTADPAVERYVQAVGARIAKFSDRDLPYEFNVINDSTPNAWALPGGKISINRGLLVELNDEAELAAVLAHEIVHSAAKHGALGASRGMLLQGAVVAATVAGSRKGYGQAAQVASSIAAQLTNQKYGRSAELESDLYGMRYMVKAGYDPQGAVDIQKTFVRLSKDSRSDFLTNLFASHPPSIERVRKNIETAAKLGKGGERGAQRFAKAMGRLKKSAPAYETFTKAQEAYQAKKYNTAAGLTQQAIRMEPNEGHFHSMLGDISLVVNKPTAAVKYFSKAINLNPNFFYYKMRRGEANQILGKTSSARSDYESSARLMPSAEAFYGLGVIAKRAGNTANAKKYLQAAAQASSATGEKALDELLDLDLGDNPGEYLAVGSGVNSQGSFSVRVTNKTPRAMTGIRLGFVANGKNYFRNFKSALGAGQSQVEDLGIRMSPAQAASIRVYVVEAKVR